MDEGLFQQYVKNVILPLYLNIVPQVVRDDGGRLLTGTVWINCDTVPGRLQASYTNVEWQSKMKDPVLRIGIGCPNATSDGQVMDDFFQTFKGYCRTSTQDLLNENIYNRMIKIRERNLQENRLDNKKIPRVVALHQGDLSVIVNGRPNDPIDKRPFNRCFTSLKIKKCWSNIGLSPFNMNALKNKNIRHEIGETESNIHVGETSQDIKKLSKDYEATKIKMKDEG